MMTELDTFEVDYLGSAIGDTSDDWIEYPFAVGKDGFFGRWYVAGPEVTIGARTMTADAELRNTLQLAHLVNSSEFDYSSELGTSLAKSTELHTRLVIAGSAINRIRDVHIPAKTFAGFMTRAITRGADSFVEGGWERVAKEAEITDTTLGAYRLPEAINEVSTVFNENYFRYLPRAELIEETRPLVSAILHPVVQVATTQQ